MIVFKPNPGTGTVIIKHPGTSADDDTPVFQLANRSFILIEGFQLKDFAYGQASIRISAAGNCGVSVLNYEIIGNIDIYPNPVSEELNIILPDSPYMVSLYHSGSQELFNQNALTTNMTINMANYIPGIYILKITGQNHTIVKK